MQSGCAFHGLRSEDPNQHLKDFLKIVDSIDLSADTRETTRLRLFQFSLRDQASQWIERLPTGSITSWDDLTTRFLAQFFPPERTAKLRNDILMFEQRQGETLYQAWARVNYLLQRVPHHGINLWLLVQIFYDHVDYHSKRTIDQAAGGNLRDKNANESWEIIEELARYSDEVWEVDQAVESACEALSSPNNTTQITEKGLCELEKRVGYLLERQKKPLSLQRATVNSISAIKPIPLSESPHRENVETFKRFGQPHPPPSDLSP